MSFDWKSLVVLARSLQEQAGSATNQEACLRSAVSRAYFGAFGHACGYAQDFLDFNPREDADDHGRLRAHLKRRRRAGDADRLERLRQWRNDADYKSDLPWANINATATIALNQAEAVFLSLIPPKKSP